MKTTSEYANAVFNILVDECGATESGRNSFISYLTSDLSSHEFRFCGELGFGGKLYYGGKSRVACYPEDLNKERDACINAANKRLKELDSL